MEPNPNKIDKIKEFKHRDKFSLAAWNSRGLNPSGDDIIFKINENLKTCIDNLTSALIQNKSNTQIKNILKSNLRTLNKNHFDTEEREFICDLYYELASIVEIDIKSELNTWLYGSILTTLLKINRILRPEKILHTLRQQCVNCASPLETYILRKETGLRPASWHIIKCSNCNELNLTEIGEDVKEFRFGNYTSIESLSKDEFSQEQAYTRLQQIKFFRK